MNSKLLPSNPQLLFEISVLITISMILTSMSAVGLMLCPEKCLLMALLIFSAVTTVFLIMGNRLGYEKANKGIIFFFGVITVFLFFYI